MHKFYSAVLVIASMLATGCTLNPPKEILFQRLGGIPVLTAVVSETVDDMSKDSRTKRSFEGVKLVKLKESIVNQLCLLTGGGCVYDGETMIKAHADARITTAEFELFVQSFRDALDRHVATREKNELLKIVAPMKRDIVGDTRVAPPVMESTTK